MKRRKFLLLGAAGAIGVAAASQEPLEKRICLFTDHLDGPDGLGWAEVAKILQQIRVAGPDLTVREGGLVLPGRVAEDLPKAATIFRDHGLTIPMISTGITSAREGRDILSVAAQLGIRYYKLGYFPYKDMNRWRETRDTVRKELASLVKLGEELNMRAGFHNHSGPIVGGTLWDILELLEPFDKKRVGIFFDPAHAMIEGGKNGWNFSLRRAQQRVTMVAIKDFIWEKVKGQWRTRWVPLGQGMVPFEDVLAILTQLPFSGPISLHIEYDIKGKTKSARFENSLLAAEHDLQFLREQLRKAYSRA